MPHIRAGEHTHTYKRHMHTYEGVMDELVQVTGREGGWEGEGDRERERESCHDTLVLGD